MDWEKQRNRLIDSIVKEGLIRTKDVEKALRKVPRHEFIPENKRTYAYQDSPLPIGSSQTISAPHMVAMMSEYLEVGKNSKILEVGTGSGYQAAVLAELTDKKVISLERIQELVEKARENLKKTGYSEQVEVVYSEGTTGYEEKAPYNRIMVTAGAPKVPDALVEQLSEGGKLLIPVGGRRIQTLIRVKKTQEGMEKEKITDVVFVPLVGKDGW